MLDTINSDDEEDIENLMNDSDTEFIDQSTIENGDLESDQSTTMNNCISFVMTYVGVKCLTRQLTLQPVGLT